MRSIVRWWRRRHETPEQQEARALCQIRAHFAAFGYDLSDFSDDEIRDGVRHFGEVAAQSGFTMAEASAGVAEWQRQVRAAKTWPQVFGSLVFGSFQQTGPKTWRWPPDSSPSSEG